MRVQTIIVLGMVLFGFLGTIGLSLVPKIALLEVPLQPAAAEQDIRILGGLFVPSGTEQDNITARSGWERLNETTGRLYWTYNPALETYIHDDLTLSIQAIEDVLSVNVSLGIPVTGAAENATGQVYFLFQLDRDVYDDSKSDNRITDWGWAIQENLSQLLRSKWYVAPGSLSIGYDIAGGGSSADAGFTLDVTLVTFVFILLLIRGRKR